MANVNQLGTVTAGCLSCAGVQSTFEWHSAGSAYGATSIAYELERGSSMRVEYRLFRCAGCGRGGIGRFEMPRDDKYPSKYMTMTSFYPDVHESRPLPKATPNEIAAEFWEGERCMDANCFRAAAAMFRSALEKTLMNAGYKPNRENLYAQIEAAAKDGMITEARKRRAHDEVRALGNDVLHDAWRELNADDAGMAQEYAARVIHDFYDDRKTVLEGLRGHGRIPAEDALVDAENR